MKIIQNDSGRIVARERLSSYLVGFLLGLVFTAVGLFLFFVQGGTWASLGPLSPDAVHVVFSGVFFLVGVLLLYFNARTTIIAEKVPAQVRVDDVHLFVLNSGRVVPLDGLKSVEVEEIRAVSRRGQSNFHYRLNLVFGDFRREMVFDTQGEAVFSLFGLLGKSSLQELCDLGRAVAALYGVPFEEKRAPGIGDLLQTAASMLSGNLPRPPAK